ncbi:hypothetical protein CRG98_044693 [Punica granatum]|uniref:Uncharacterized protein n=1 Tax=Punica granatum TaxID=22663 RepID=A0A2I0HTK2_PUNGR|nr:hypothetical protein CRG98_044693 [Punica granatum]
MAQGLESGGVRSFSGDDAIGVDRETVLSWASNPGPFGPSMGIVGRTAHRANIYQRRG